MFHSQSNDVHHQDWSKVKFGKAKIIKEKKTKKILKRKTPVVHDDVKIKNISKDLAKAIIAARCAKKWNQKELARMSNVSVAIVKDYEMAKGFVNQRYILKFERALNTHLTGSLIGTPLR